MNASKRPQPTYPLDVVKDLVQRELWALEPRAALRAIDLQYEREDVKACILALEDNDFHKTMQDNRPGKEGLWQDAYNLPFNHLDYEDELYIKVQVTDEGRAVVISFKQWGAPA